MILNIRGIDIQIDNFSNEAYAQVAKQLKKGLANLKIKNRDVIQNAFALAISLAPHANPSDLWHHIVYRLYREKVVRLRKVDDAINSWVRASGDAFETFHANYYNQMLSDTDIRLIPLLSKQARIAALQKMDIYGKVGDSKLDTAIIKGCPAGAIPTLAMEVIGGVHLKVSLAERVSDDVPCSRAMMDNGYLSVLATLDVKSFPKSTTISDGRAYINNGELGSSEVPTDKRKYIELHGSFDAAFSYNSRTFQSPLKTASGKRIFTSDFSGRRDAFYDLLTKKAKESN